MKDETKIWMKYAEENLKSAKILLESELFNPCLQEAQQSVEKAMKALLVEFSIMIKKTHSIKKLKKLLYKEGLDIPITKEEYSLLDSIYLPSKYPLGSALPDYNPGVETCRTAIQIAEKVIASVKNHLE